MTKNPSIEDRLEQLGRELKSSPSVSERVREAVRSLPTVAKDVRSPTGRRKRFSLVATVAASLILLVAFVWLARPRTIHARALAALKKVDTIHVTGWTTRIQRKWPLEGPKRSTERQKHLVDAWFWMTDEATPRSWRKQGPVIQNETGPQLQEYQEDADLLYVQEGGGDDFVNDLSTLASYLKGLERLGMKKESLGSRQQGGRTLRGLKVAQGNRTKEYWFDSETDLPVLYTQTQRNKTAAPDSFELHFEYDQSIPQEVTSWRPPKTDNIRYGSGNKAQQVWRDHVASIGETLNRQGTDQNVMLLDRGGRSFRSQWRLRTPDSEYWVLPIDVDQYENMTLSDFISRHAARVTSHESWRVPKELADLELNRQDLVYRDGTAWEEWVQHLLNVYDLEFHDQMEQRTFWIAHHDGRQLKPWRQVVPPVPYIVENGVKRIGVVRVGIGQHGSPVTMHELFDDFNRLQNRYLTADSPIIEDQTGLPRPAPRDRETYATAKQYEENVKSKHYVAADSPWFAGGKHSAESQPMAREWFEKEFGITFEQETRQMTVHVVRRL